MSPVSTEYPETFGAANKDQLRVQQRTPKKFLLLWQQMEGMWLKRNVQTLHRKTADTSGNSKSGQRDPSPVGFPGERGGGGGGGEQTQVHKGKYQEATAGSQGEIPPR